MRILFLSGDRQSGKTTKLFEWRKDKNNVAGILMPDINGERFLYHIEEKRILPTETETTKNQEPNYISVGNFRFLEASFLQANQIIIEAINANKEFVVIDEFGKLELNKQGFYPAVLFAINAIKQNTYSGTLILTVRDIYMDTVIDMLEIKPPRVLYDLEAV